MLVGDVRNDPRYLNTVDAVRTELAVPMTARGKLVGVIDLQSTRVNAYTEYDRALMRLIAARVGIAIDNARLYRRVERQNRTLKTLANISREFSSILDLNELLGKIASTMRDLIDYDAFSILSVDHEAKALRHLFSIRYDQRVNIDNVPLGKGITGAAAESREVVRVHDTAKDPRYIASHPDIRSEVAVPLIVQDRVVGVMDLESDRVGYFTDDHVRTLALLAPQVASSRGKRAAVRRTGAARAPHGGGPEGRARTAAHPAARCRTGDRGPGSGGPPASGARNLGRHLRYLRTARRPDRDRLRRRQRQGRRGGALRRPDERPAAHAGAAPAASRGVDAALNDALVERKVEARYVTLGLLLWDATTRRIVMANAGAIPPMICRGSEILKIRVEGVPLGLLDAREYEEVTFQAEPGDTIVLYSDGITDHINASGTEFGRGRLAQVVRSHCQHLGGRLDSGDLQRAGQVLHGGLRRSERVRDEGKMTAGMAPVYESAHVARS